MVRDEVRGRQPSGCRLKTYFSFQPTPAAPTYTRLLIIIKEVLPDLVATPTFCTMGHQVLLCIGITLQFLTES